MTTRDTYDVIVIGGGANGLTAAAVLAKAGKRVIVLEGAEDVGGIHRPVEFTPGFRAPLHEDCGWIPPSVVRALGASPARLKRVSGAQSVSVVKPGGGVFSLWTDPQHAAISIREYSQRDAERWPAFAKRMRAFATVLGALYELAPPDVDTTSFAEAASLLMVGRKLRALGRDDMTEFLRVMPMSIQDLLDDTFESALLKAAVAAGAIRDLRQGPRSGGTVFNLLHYMVGAPEGSVRGRAWWANGPEAFTRLAEDVARRAGATLRMSTRVERVMVKDYVVTGVVLQGGDEIDAPLVVSTADPVHTFGELVDPVWLDPEFLLAVRNIKLRGCTAFVLYALDRMPGNPVIDPSAVRSTVSLTGDTTVLERAADAAKYGEMSPAPHVEFFMPTARWPSLAAQGKHVLVARVQYAPYALKGGESLWNDARATALAEVVTNALTHAIPGFSETVSHRAALSPRDLESRFGLTGGALTQGELTLDQILFMRPVPGWGRYETPIRGLYYGGSGAHPGPGVLGGAGLLAAKRALG